MKTAAITIQAFWDALQARKWDEVSELLHESFRAEFPQSGEHFNRQDFIRMNRFYPGAWDIRLRDLFEYKGRVVTEVEVTLNGRTERAISFFQVRNGKVIELREFWPEPFPVPEWRRALFALGEVVP